jgi:DNA repair protein SbcC/Rad50
MTPQLEAITLTNFRSVNTPVRIPLDAPVVLIHGQNGTGKTSILSGIELALTGDIPSLRRIESDYRQHLVYKDAESARLDLTAHGLPNGRSEASLTITSHSIVGQPLLTGELAKTYSERCYLAQVTLGRLLEIYQGQDAQSSSSPLTLFVKELLGLDVIESIVDGLHDAGDVRRVRNAVPAYSEVERKISEIERRQTRISGGLKDVDAAIAFQLEGLQAEAVPLGLSISSTIVNYGDLLKDLEARSSKHQLMKVARIRRDLLAAKERLATIKSNSGVDQRTRLEASDSSARRQVEEWRQGRGKLLNGTITLLLSTFPSLPSPDSVNPEVARLAALRAVESEIRRYSDLITKQEQVAKRLEEIQAESERLDERSRRLDEQMGAHASNAGSLAQALASLLPHIHSEECPVCGRDYGEISKTPLVSAVSQKLGALTESAGMLEALSKEKTAAVAHLAGLRRERDGLVASQSSQVATEEANTVRAGLQLVKQRLDGLANDTARATILIQDAAVAARKLSEARESDDQVSSLIETVRQIANQLMGEFSFPDQPLEVQLSQLLEFAEKEESSINALEEHRTSALSRIQALQAQHTSRDSFIKEQSDALQELVSLRNVKAKADDTIETARGLSKKVLEVRTEIVQRVFNESLNRLWKDLFTRLAPAENFVPAFALPRKPSGAIEAVLETVHRKGQRSGNPRMMLSAGNMNTAALTLFLALHLSLNPKLPWLLIDDPVQSMDEVHISQFAALLRTLSKRSDRRIVIAIHERPLYEYLALELSPAFAEDKLITVELGRNASGDTIAKATHHIWKDDKAISAA